MMRMRMIRGWSVCMFVCVCVCERERMREIKMMKNDEDEPRESRFRWKKVNFYSNEEEKINESKENYFINCG